MSSQKATPKDEKRGNLEKEQERGEKIDRKTILLLEKLNEYEEKRKESNELTNTGFLDLSKAKFSSFNYQKFTTFNYDLRPHKSSKQIEILDGLISPKIAEIKYTTIPKKAPDSKEKTTEVRNRKKNDHSVNSNAGTSKTSEVKIEEGGNEVKDPIKMFGVLVPMSLKQTQQSFSKSVQIYIELAILQKEIGELVTEIESIESN